MEYTVNANRRALLSMLRETAGTCPATTMSSDPRFLYLECRSPRYRCARGNGVSLENTIIEEPSGVSGVGFFFRSPRANAATECKLVISWSVVRGGGWARHGRRDENRI